MITSSSSSSSSSTPSLNKMESSAGKPRTPTKWSTAGQQRAYGRRLLEALRATAGGGTLAVKAAADAALALSARGQSRWSRAILLGRLRSRRKLLRMAGKIGRGRTRTAATRVRPDRLRVLRRLVPGCRKLSASSVLEEAADYVAALEMQVKAMRALADAFSAARAAEAEAQGGV